MHANVWVRRGCRGGCMYASKQDFILFFLLFALLFSHSRLERVEIGFDIGYDDGMRLMRSHWKSDAYCWSNDVPVKVEIDKISRWCDGRDETGFRKGGEIETLSTSVNFHCVLGNVFMKWKYVPSLRFMWNMYAGFDWDWICV